MPATEQTWYDQKLLHVVFGFSSIAMFIATVWMFAADHDREWKGYQRRYRDIEQRLTDWRIRDAEAAAQDSELSELEEKLALARTEPPTRSLFTNFKQEVLNDEVSRGELAQDKYDAEIDTLKKWYGGDAAATSSIRSLSNLDKRYDELATLSEEATAQRGELTKARQAVEASQQELLSVKQKMKDAASATEDERTAIQAMIDKAESALTQAESTASNLSGDSDGIISKCDRVRTKLMNGLQEIVGKAKFREEQLLSRRKFRSADFDAAKANLDLAVRDNKPAEIQADLQSVVDGIVGDTETEGSLKYLTLKRQEATAHRGKLQSLVRDMTSTEADLSKKIEEVQSDVTRLTTSKVERRSTYFVGVPPFLGKKWLELPILDAFGSPLKIDNLWTEGLTMENGSFGQVRRFDRCTTCHQGIDKTAPGSAVIPAYTPEQQFDVVVATPSSRPMETDVDGNPLPLDVKKIYGLSFSDAGLSNDNDVVINSLVPGSSAAVGKAIADAHGEDVVSGIQVGDVILAINGDEPLDANDARQYLTEGIEWGQPIVLTVRRGLPQPYTSHPRLDLFVGSLSPHSLAVFGCTSCHEGQGSATAFKFASHAPNDTEQEEQWMKDHGWFNNHHWIFPMFPKRFAESSCLKCHHEVASLEPSSRFPEPPAPKVVEG
ncbi:MAG: hypothetical protein AAF497_20980, partial [Planctomycetota bacterium]